MTARTHSIDRGVTLPKRSAEHGFTLVEVMIALLIFGMIAAAGVAILQFSVRAQTATAARLDDVTALARTVSILSADLGQALPRSTRDQTGVVRPAMSGGLGDGALMLFVRGGWDNLDGAPRPGIQKVAYRLDGDALQRIAWPQVDGAAPLPPTILLTGLRSAAIRFRSRGAWSDTWQVPAEVPLPDAVELNLLTARGAAFHQLFLVGTGYVPAPPGVPGATPTPSPTGTPGA